MLRIQYSHYLPVIKHSNICITAQVYFKPLLKILNFPTTQNTYLNTSLLSHNKHLHCPKSSHTRTWPCILSTSSHYFTLTIFFPISVSDFLPRSRASFFHKHSTWKTKSLEKRVSRRMLEKRVETDSSRHV